MNTHLSIRKMNLNILFLFLVWTGITIAGNIKNSPGIRRGRDAGNICSRIIECSKDDGKDSVYGPLEDCTRFCQCSNGKAYTHNCPRGLHFNPVLNVCDYPDRAGCDFSGESSEENTSDGENEDNNCTNNYEQDKHEENGNSIGCQLECPRVDGPDSVYEPLEDCTRYCQCSNGISLIHDCPSGLHFNPFLNVCDYPDQAGCNSGGNGDNDSNNDEHNEDADNGSNNDEQSGNGDNGSNNNDQIGNGSNENNSNSCQIQCPEIDGPDSIYEPLEDCTKFCQCSNGIAHVHNCPSGLHFNPVLNVCEYPDRAGCNSGNNNDGNGENGSSNDEQSGNENNGSNNDEQSEDGNNGSNNDEQSGNGDNDSNNDKQSGDGDNGSNNEEQNGNADNGGHNDEQSENGGNGGNNENGNGSNNNSSNGCQIQCPEIDGPDSIYEPLEDCTKFCQCSNGIAHVHNCPSGLHFNPVLNVCEYPDRAGCNSGNNNDGNGDNGSSNDEQSGNENNGSNNDEQSGNGDNDSNNDEQSGDGDNGSNNEEQNGNADNGGHNDEQSENGGNGGNNENGNGSNNNSSNGCQIQCPEIDGPDSIYEPLEDCTKFCQCSNGIAHIHNCPSGLHFNPVLNVCEYPDRAGCNGGNNNDGNGENGSNNDEQSGNENNGSNNNEQSGDGDNDSNNDEQNGNADNGGHNDEQSGNGGNGGNNENGNGSNNNSSNGCQIQCPEIDGPDSIYEPLEDCTKFCQCSNGIAHVHNCPSGLHFNPVLNVCEYPDRAGCNSGNNNDGNGENGSSNDEQSGNENNGSNNDEQSEDGNNGSNNDEQSGNGDNDSNNDEQSGDGDNGSNNEEQNGNADNGGHNDEQSGNGGNGGNNENGNGSTNNSSNGCQIQCPEIDGPDSIYEPLEDCTKFCQCSNGIAHVHNCPSGLHFNPVLNVCEYPDRAGCNSGNNNDGNGDNGSSNDEQSGNENNGSNNDEQSGNGDNDSNNDEQSGDGDNGSNNEEQNGNADNGGHNDEQSENGGNGGNNENGNGSNNNSSNGCQIQCPEIDGPDSIYEPLEDCTKFCQCSNGIAHIHNCPSGLHFNPVLNVCEYPDRAGCNSGNNNDGNGDNGSSNDEQSGNENNGSNNDEQSGNGDNDSNNDEQSGDGDNDSNNDEQNGNADNGGHNDEQSGNGGNGGNNENGNGSTNNSSNGCQIQCPEIDGPDSIYEPLEDCTKFCQCSNGIAHVHNCPSGLHFNPVLNVCEYPDRAGCNSGNNNDGNGDNGSNNDEQSGNGDNGSNNEEQNGNADNGGHNDEQSGNGGNGGNNENGNGSNNNSSNGCQIQCPEIDGPDSIYEPLEDCTRFCQCSNGIAHVHNCPSELHFNPVLNVCEYPDRAGCNGGNNDFGNGYNGSNNDEQSGDGNNGSINNEQDGNGCEIQCPEIDGPNSVYGPLEDCTRFCQCSNGVAHILDCPSGLHFNPTLNVCDYPDRANNYRCSIPS